MGTISVKCDGDVCAVYEGSVCLIGELEKGEAMRLAPLFEVGIRMASEPPTIQRLAPLLKTRPKRITRMGGKSSRSTDIGAGGSGASSLRIKAR